VQARANVFGLTYGQTGELDAGNEEVARALAMGFVVEVDSNGTPKGGAAPLAPSQVGGCGCGGRA
jgi:hypothetical protein